MIDRQTKNSAKLPFLAKFVLVSMVTPLFFYLGPLLMTPNRLIFLVLVPIVFFQLAAGRYGGFIFTDFLLVAFFGWFGLAMLINSPNHAISYTGMNALLGLGGYFLARATITSVERFRAALKFMLLIALIFLPLAIMESITGGFVIPKLISSIPGVFSVHDVNYPRRLGLDRAQVVFAHPILYGMFNAMWVGAFLFAMKPVMSLVKRAFGGLVFTLCVVTSMSSGPMIGAIFGFGMLSYDVFFKDNEKKWKLLLWSSFAAYIVLDIISNRPILYVISSKVALNAWTANYRLQQVYAGMEQIAKVPIFGVGLNDWERPIWMSSSIDNNFLLMAIQAGVPCFLLFMAVFLNCLFRGGRNGFRYGSDLYYARIGWNVSLFATMLILATVAAFGDLLPWMYFMIGSGCFLFNAHEPDKNDVEVRERPKRRAIFGDINHDDEPEKPEQQVPKPPRPVPVLGRMT